MCPSHPKSPEQPPDDSFCSILDQDPMFLFRSWFAQACQKELSEPNAMALATVDPTGMPNVRMVLMKDFTENGPVFYTNAESAKGRELCQHNKAACLFHWKSLQQQVRMRGLILPVQDQTADSYFASRPRASQIAAWASTQSSPMQSRELLLQKIHALEKQYAQKPIPRPSYWRGFQLQINEIEFWLEQPSRLHKRALFKRKTLEEHWEPLFLFP